MTQVYCWILDLTVKRLEDQCWSRQCCPGAGWCGCRGPSTWCIRHTSHRSWPGPASPPSQTCWASCTWAPVCPPATTSCPASSPGWMTGAELVTSWWPVSSGHHPEHLSSPSRVWPSLPVCECELLWRKGEGSCSLQQCNLPPGMFLRMLEPWCWHALTAFLLTCQVLCHHIWNNI